jgi:catechol 2,3-dioxygenase-like lactoylglutathione lyase family enzyme
MPAIHGLLETAIYVDDVQRAAAFYGRLFGFETLLESERLVALSVAGKDVLLLFKKGATTKPYAASGGVIPPHDGSGATHFAFSVAKDELPKWRDRLQSEGVGIESTVTWDGGAESIYFRDPDGHLVELITPGFWRVY